MHSSATRRRLAGLARRSDTLAGRADRAADRAGNTGRWTGNLPPARQFVKPCAGGRT
jgi:hypothetical protein